jgi:hypothetical protein
VNDGNRRAGRCHFFTHSAEGEKPLFTQHEIAKVACGGPRRLCSFPSKVDRAAAGPRRGKQEVFSSVHAAKASSSAGSGGVRERQAASVNESKDETRKRKKAGRGRLIGTSDILHVPFYRSAPIGSSCPCSVDTKCRCSLSVSC